MEWASELVQHGIRVVTLKTGGVPETISEDDARRDEIPAGIQAGTSLNRVVTLADVGNVAAFVASYRAGAITSTEINISCGAIID